MTLKNILWLCYKNRTDTIITAKIHDSINTTTINKQPIVD